MKKNYAVSCGSIPEGLLGECFKIPDDGVDVVFTNSGNTTTYYPQSTEYVGSYSTNNGATCFVYLDGETYCTRSKEVVKALKAEGYHKTFEIFVPFSNGEKILDEHYEALWKRAS